MSWHFWKGLWGILMDRLSIPNLERAPMGTGSTETRMALNSTNPRRRDTARETRSEGERWISAAGSGLVITVVTAATFC